MDAFKKAGRVEVGPEGPPPAKGRRKYRRRVRARLKAADRRGEEK